MRTRTTNQPNVWPAGVAQAFRYGVLENTFNIGPIVVEDVSSIVDEYQRPRLENEVDHYRWRIVPFGSPGSINSSSPGLVVTHDNKYRQIELWNAYGRYFYHLDWDISPLDHVQALRSEAWNKVRPSFNRDDLNIPVFLLELKQLSLLLKTWKRSDPIIRNIASTNLGYRFGVRPFIGDVAGLAEALQSFHDKWKTFFEQAGKPQVRHVKLPLGSLFESVTNYNLGFSWWHGNRSVAPATAIYTLTVRYSYEVQVPHALAQVAAFLDRIGGLLNPSILWELTPYSFVIDWFFDVGGFLRSLRVDTLPLTVNVHSATESFKYEASCVTSARIEDFTYTAYTETMKQYRRRPVPIGDLGSVIQSGPGLNGVRVGLLASLFVVKIGSPKRWSSKRLISKFLGYLRRSGRQLPSNRVNINNVFRNTAK